VGGLAVPLPEARTCGVVVLIRRTNTRAPAAAAVARTQWSGFAYMLVNLHIEESVRLPTAMPLTRALKYL
jgi:hypothetical protein